MLTFITAELGLKTSNETKLLELLGRDLPGAVTVVRFEAEARTQSFFRFESESAMQGEGTDQALVRFSAAGIQLKLSMLADGNTLRLAGRGELGRAYVKFPGRYPLVPQNEYTMMSLAALAGIDVPTVRLISGDTLGPVPEAFERFRGERIYVVERFDRTADGNRVHIEDMNQVLGQWAEQKYSGASYESLGRLIRALCGDDDFLEYVRRVAFNILVGNEDAHLKNWSLIYADGRTPRLSPAYDIVSTAVFEGLTRETGLKIGGRRNAAKVTLATFRRLAEKAGYESPEDVEDLVVDLNVRVKSSIEHVRSGSVLPDEFWRQWILYRESLPLAAGQRE